MIKIIRNGLLPHLVAVAVLFGALSVSQTAQANIIGMATCSMFCNKVYGSGASTPDPTGLKACNGLCGAMKACNTFTWDKCFAVCSRPAQGASYIGYYGVTVPCATICNEMFPN